MPAHRALFEASRSTGQAGTRLHTHMHLSSYLMIAALILMGLQLAYAFYQLATLVL
jgi:hypothetical protein